MSRQLLSVLTYNIHKGFSALNRYHTIEPIRQALIQASPDIICLQELQGLHPKKRFIPGAAPKADDLDLLLESDHWPHHVYAQNATYSEGHHGNGIISNLPFDMIENVNLAKNIRSSRSLLHVTYLPPHTPIPIHVICVHLGLTIRARKEQIAILCQRIRVHVPDDHALIVAGDFNDWLSHARQPLEYELGLNEVNMMMQGKYACTFPSPKPLLRVDRIYFRGLKCLSSQVLKGIPWCYLSDHLPLIAEFEVES